MSRYSNRGVVMCGMCTSPSATGKEEMQMYVVFVNAVQCSAVPLHDLLPGFSTLLEDPTL